MIEERSSSQHVLDAAAAVASVRQSDDALLLLPERIAGDFGYYRVQQATILLAALGRNRVSASFLHDPSHRRSLDESLAFPGHASVRLFCLSAMNQEVASRVVEAIADFVRLVTHVAETSDEDIPLHVLVGRAPTQGQSNALHGNYVSAVEWHGTIRAGALTAIKEILNQSRSGSNEVQ